MYLIDNVAELRFVNRFIYAIKRIYTQVHAQKRNREAERGWVRQREIERKRERKRERERERDMGG